MNAQSKIEPSGSTSISVIVAQTPAVVLTDEHQRDALYDHIQREIDEFKADVTTNKGREAIKSLAYKITRTKTAIDAAGKQLNEDRRAQINAVDAERRAAKERLTAMAEEVRKPLTEWEAAEKARNEWADELIASFKSGAVVTLDDTAASVRERGKKAWDVIVSEETLGDRHADVQAMKDQCCELLKAALARLTKEEADKAELEKLRAEAAERDRVEQERIAAEQEAAQRAEQERIAEARRVAAEQAEAERIERAKQEAADAARREAEDAARKEREEAERAKQAEIDAANERARQAEEAAQRQRDEAEKAERERAEQAEAEAAEQRRRDEDKAHRGQVMAAAKNAIMTCGADEETAKKIVLAIRAGEVPAVSLRF